MNEPRVLILCHGNINRSALAEAVVRHFAGIMLNVTSAGFTSPGRRAAKKMRDAASARGYSLEGHRSQLVTRDMVLDADVVIYMDGGNLRRLRRLMDVPKGGDVPAWCYPLGPWAEPSVDRIPDPAFMRRGSPEFEETVELIEEASRNLANELIA